MRLQPLPLAFLLMAWTTGSLSQSTQYSNACTPTKTIQFDFPDFNWRDAEMRDRNKYGPQKYHTYGAQELSGMIARPQTVEQLLRNLKVAVDRDLVEQQGFFDTKVLTKFFGASSVKWTINQLDAGSTEKSGTVELSHGPFDGYQVTVRMVRMPIAKENSAYSNHAPEHVRRSATIDIHVNNSRAAIKVLTVVEVFGMPPLAVRGCSETLHGGQPAATTNFTCKGKMHYDYSKLDFAAAIMGENVTTFVVRKDLMERRSTLWSPRDIKGRQSFLCDEDEVRDIELRQEL